MAISFCLNEAKQCIFEINGDLDSSLYTEIQCLHDDLNKAKASKIIENGLHEFIDQLQIKMNKINQSIYAAFCDVRIPISKE